MSKKINELQEKLSALQDEFKCPRCGKQIETGNKGSWGLSACDCGWDQAYDDSFTPKPTFPLVCIFGCKDPVVAVVHTPSGCTCAGNQYQPRCQQHLTRLFDTDGGEFSIVEDFRIITP